MYVDVRLSHPNKDYLLNLQVKLCDPCLSALEVVTTMRYTNRRLLYFTLLCCGDVNKDFSHKDQDKDQDLAVKDKD